MEINHVSGNVQPLTKVSGRSLPQIQSGGVADASPPESASVNSPQLNIDIRDALSSLQTRLGNSAENDSQDQISQNIQRRLSFKIDDELGKTVVRVFDKETEELIRQFPPEELLTLSKRLKELNEKLGGSSNLGLLIKSEV
ncbi:MAG: flagellar protein FlaG [Gammaproteobacteria bacterium]|nr:flagellar protein FlaG [Gammaproteobacteria bacterium]MDH5629192.1 flagellar protein FlaG [Gammaproteobacteria bacterium]